MRRVVFLAAVAALLCVVAAFAASLPDSRVQGHAVLARRGSLGADDYVATNVTACSSAYVMHAPTDGRLRDRAVNVVSVDSTNAVFAVPGRRTVAGFARGFLVSVVAATNAVVRFEGANGIYSSDATVEFRIPPGRSMFSFIEIGDNEYLAAWRELTEIRQEGE